MKKQLKIGLIMGIAALCAAAVAEKQTGVIRRAVFNSKSSGEYNHFLPCSKLPTEAEIQRVLREHRDVIDKIKKIRREASGSGKTDISGPLMWVTFGNGEKNEEYPVKGDTGGSYNGIHFIAPEPSEKCPGKADIYITFGGVSDSVLLKEIIGGDTFFGIPYRMHNM